MGKQIKRYVSQSACAILGGTIKFHCIVEYTDGTMGEVYEMKDFTKPVGPHGYVPVETEKLP